MLSFTVVGTDDKRQPFDDITDAGGGGSWTIRISIRGGWCDGCWFRQDPHWG